MALRDLLLCMTQRYLVRLMALRDLLLYMTQRDLVRLMALLDLILYMTQRDLVRFETLTTVRIHICRAAGPSAGGISRLEHRRISECHISSLCPATTACTVQYIHFFCSNATVPSKQRINKHSLSSALICHLTQP